jgi:hypothetical protein
MAEQHPITPPPELVQQWVAEIWHEGTPVRVALSDEHIATRAAQWGADQELKACCDWFQDFYKLETWMERDLKAFRVDRRPKPVTLKQQALEAARIELNPEGKNGSLILKALEALPND